MSIEILIKDEINNAPKHYIYTTYYLTFIDINDTLLKRVSIVCLYAGGKLGYCYS